MHRNWACIVMVSGLAGASLCHAALASTSPASPRVATASTTETDEIVVRATPLYELRAAVVAAEERFYERYNELNKVKDFDIECVVAAPTGSRLKQRICRSRLVLNAQIDQAREFAQMVQDQGSPNAAEDRAPAGVRGAPTTTDPNAVFQARYEDYKENVLYLLKMNPDLRRLVYERKQAEKRYDAERARRFKERWLDF